MEDNTDIAKSKVVVIGLDGGSFQVLRPLIQAGFMPTLGRFLREGASGTLFSTRPPVTCPAWPTMYTGVNPGKHGVFSFTCRTESRNSPHTASLLDVRAPALWELLGDAGYRVGVMNVPITFPAQPVNGFMVSGFPASDDIADVVWPREESSRLLSELPDFVVNWPGLAERSLEKKGRLGVIETANSLLQARIRSFEYFLDRHDIDFCFLVFEYTDKVQHWFFPLLGAADGSLDKESLDAQNLLRLGYAEVDAAIARLVQRFGENTNYIVVSDHGFGSIERIVYINHLLEKHGLFTSRSAKAVAARLAGRARLPLRIRQMLGLAQDEPWHRLNTWESPLTNFGKTQAFGGHQYEQAVYVNAEGVCPHGIVGQGQQYNQVRQKVVEVLRQARDSKKDKNIFEGAWIGKDVYKGKYLDYSPDVIFELAAGYMVSSGIGLSCVLENGFLRDARPSDAMGYHRPDGIFMGWGPAFGAVQNVQTSLLDIVPTVLALMDLPMTQDMDGRVIEEAIKPGSISPAKMSNKKSAHKNKRDSGRVYSVEDEKQIARRLADLGYL